MIQNIEKMVVICDVYVCTQYIYIYNTYIPSSNVSYSIHYIFTTRLYYYYYYCDIFITASYMIFTHNTPLDKFYAFNKGRFY